MEISFLTVANGVFISLFLEYFPSVNVWFDALPPKKKQGVVLVFMLVTSLIMFGAGCAGTWDTGLECTSLGLKELMQFVVNYIITVTIGAATHASTKELG